MPYKQRYGELLEVWLAWRRGTRSDRRRGSRGAAPQDPGARAGDHRVRPTRTTSLPAHTIDADFLAALQEDESLTPDEKATDIEAALVHETKVRGEDDPRARAIIERLARLRRKREKQAQMTLDGLKEWEDLVREHVAEDQESRELSDSTTRARSLMRSCAARLRASTMTSSSSLRGHERALPRDSPASPAGANARTSSRAAACGHHRARWPP